MADFHHDLLNSISPNLKSLTLHFLSYKHLNFALSCDFLPQTDLHLICEILIPILSFFRAYHFWTRGKHNLHKKDRQMGHNPQWGLLKGYTQNLYQWCTAHVVVGNFTFNWQHEDIYSYLILTSYDSSTHLVYCHCWVDDEGHSACKKPTPALPKGFIAVNRLYTRSKPGTQNVQDKI